MKQPATQFVAEQIDPVPQLSPSALGVATDMPAVHVSSVHAFPSSRTSASSASSINAPALQTLRLQSPAICVAASTPSVLGVSPQASSAVHTTSTHSLLGGGHLAGSHSTPPPALVLPALAPAPSGVHPTPNVAAPMARARAPMVELGLGPDKRLVGASLVNKQKIFTCPRKNRWGWVFGLGSLPSRRTSASVDAHRNHRANTEQARQRRHTPNTRCISPIKGAKHLGNVSRSLSLGTHEGPCANELFSPNY